MFIVNLFCILFSRPVSVNVDKDITHTVHLQINITSLELWIIFPVTFLFLLVWCKQKTDKKVKFFRLFLMCVIFFCFLDTKILQISLMTWELVPDQDFLRLAFINFCDDFQFSATRINTIFYYVSKLKHRNLNLYFHLLIILSGDISLNPGPTQQHKLQCLNKWNIFKSRGFHFIYLTISSLFPKIEEFRIIAKSTNTTIISISES